MRYRSSKSVPIWLVGLGLVLAACDESASADAPQSAPPDVGIVTVKAESFALTRELPGRVAPTRVADVRPRVSGIVVQRLFEQGSDVKAGEALYQIDPKPFEVELQASEAALERAKAALELAQQQVNRSSAMVKAQAIATAQHEIAVATVAQNKAEVAAREADVARARLNLDYATIRAPISGRIGAARATEGALVVQNDTVNLATIQQLDTIYADFTQSVAELNRLRRAFESGDLERPAPDAVKVRLVLDDGTTYAHAGKLLFSEARVDASSGQVTLRGEFANPNRELLPGMYVRVLLDQGVDSDAITVPEQAVQRNGGGGSEVFVVKDDNRAALQPVRLGAAQDGRWLVVEGLKPGDRVVIDGFQKFAAGDSVKPRSVTQSAEVERPRIVGSR
ncbi:efflux RND transporter periplasmic adaptor subunit [Reyranella soli]|uniref:efflux RND transporter periplasmic adaptor subunit n=1 Tax=Reyranella soli TaxID=1230389 RepID=UPI0011BD5A81|nr:efflux RND transporter periplasmic adaptor subunit [Reyranella soli]